MQSIISTQPLAKSESKALKLLEIQQDLVTKVVPSVVCFLRETLAESILNCHSITSCKDIKLRPSAITLIRNALTNYVRIDSAKQPFEI